MKDRPSPSLSLSSSSTASASSTARQEPSQGRSLRQHSSARSSWASASCRSFLPLLLLLLPLLFLLFGQVGTCRAAWIGPSSSLLPRLTRAGLRPASRSPIGTFGGRIPVSATAATSAARSEATMASADEDGGLSSSNTRLISPIKSLNGIVTLPGSKSLSNRCLLLAALAKGTTVVENLLESDDIRYMLGALQTLKVPVTLHDDTDGAAAGTVVTVEGQGGPIPFPRDDKGGDGSSGSVVELFLGNAGTAMRPLAAALCYDQSDHTGDGNIDDSNSSGEKTYVLDGVARMRERPIADLVDGLRQLGASVSCVAETGCPPVTIHVGSKSGSTIQKGGSCSISGKMSSQFLSALLMAAPLADGDVTISIKDELISAPYVSLTIGLMKKFGVTVQVEGELDGGTPSFFISRDQRYLSPGSVLVEGDASSASYFLAGAAITGGTVTVRGCGSDSVQGDVEFASVLEQMGATVTWKPDSITVTRDPQTRLRGVDVDCGKIPDAAMTLAAIALFAEGPTTIRNVFSWRLKETERMKAIVAECTKLGATVEEYRDYCVIHPPLNNQVNDNVLIETYDDHRMAMTFSLAACGGVNVIINDPGCTAKTFPTYFDALEGLASRDETQ